MKALITTLFFVIATLISVIAASLLINPPAHSAETWGLDAAYINYRQYGGGATNYLVTNNGLPGRSLDKGLSLHLDTTFWSYFYFNNIIHSETDRGPDGGGQFRTIGWDFRLGARLFPWLDMEYRHHSQHILDWQGPNHFPVEDSIGVNLYLYRAKSRDSIF